MKNIGILEFSDKYESSISSIELKVIGVPIYQLALDSVIQSGVFDQVFIAADLAQLDFNNIEMTHPQAPAGSSNLRPEVVQFESSILELFKENKFKSDDWITFINPAFPFQSMDYFKTLQTIIKSENFDYVYPQVELANSLFEIEEAREPALTTGNNYRKKESGLFKSIKLGAMLDIKRVSYNRAGFLDVSSSDDVEIRNIKDMHKSYSRIRDIITARRKNFIERVVSVDESDYFDVKTDPDGVERDFLSEVQGRLDFAENEIKEVKNYLSAIDSNNVVNILDVGCGTGVISGEFKDSNVHITGIEPSQVACDLAKNRLDSVLCGVYENFTHDFDDASFDVIIAFHVIEHVDDPNNFLDEISRIIKPGGFAVISTPDFEGPMAKKYGQNFRLYNDPTHISLFGMTGLIKSIEARNLSIIKIDQPFIATKYFSKENVMRLFSDEKISPPFTGNVVSIFVTK